MNEQNNPPEKQDDEISLLDLFAVLIRYRKLIVIGTLCAALLGAVFFVARPVASNLLNGGGFSFPPPAYDVTFNVNVQDVPSALKNYLVNNLSGREFALNTYVTSLFSNAPFLTQVYKRYPLWPVVSESGKEIERPTDIETLSFVSRSIASSSSSLQEAPAEDVLVSCSLADDRTDYAENALFQFSVTLNKAPEDRVFRQEGGEGADSQGAVSGEDWLASDFAAAALAEADRLAQERILPVLASVAEDPNTQTMIARQTASYLASFQGFFFLDPTPVARVFKTGSWLMGLLITVFAGFFLFVFLAFLLNAVRNVKNDPDARRVIEDAWNSGK